MPIITDTHGNDKYALATISFTVQEVEPYDADLVAISGSFRGLNATLERNLWKTSGSLSGNYVKSNRSR